MKRLGCMFLAIILSLALVITPVMAKGGGGAGSSGGGKASSVSSSNSSGGEKGSSVTPGNSGNKSSAGVKASSNSKPGSNKADSTNRSQSKKYSNVYSGNKATDGVDLTRGNKELVQQRIQSREVNTVKKQFKDTEGHWAHNSIQKAQRFGIIQGYEDGKFNPDAVVSQVEAMVMVVNLTELISDEILSDETDNTGSDQITDETTGDDETTDEISEDDGTVSDDEEDVADVPAWARNQARKASLANFININRFHSEVQANRAQVAVMLAKALELEAVEVDENAFTDTLKMTPEDIGYILALKDAGVISGASDGKFNPNSAITRAEIATMLANVLESIENEDTTEDTTGDTGTQTEDTTATVI